ncbi:hypothetical protein [Allorhizobium taibaishanense]|uniref:Uncharacterized protein n=1 Tax=Allorhizobium taibaishanense TaxID=887144 RepID=A0A7W6HQ69_9HYPH|nr:hypothetical protein [Allorhizobium taibaishanense]MBB4009341.1 hypothetical protein [Allorhizobium taibaishanense]
MLTLKDARERAQSILRDIQLGTFQPHDVEPAPPVWTLGDVILSSSRDAPSAKLRTGRVARAFCDA